MKMVMESSSSSTATTNVTSNQSSNMNTPGNNCQPNAQFNPQSLGREFVRQYYTVLNEGPHIMHRFYSDDSSLVHGGSNRQGESTVYGQAEINSKIMSLNFKDCHTKIRQVDSMETVGKGVVIQVIGELSNNGEPMRRFFQTFVLAPRSPSNYYVRNDIFRYQDEVFVDDDEYNDADKTDELDKIDNEQKGHEKTEAVVTQIPVKENVYEAVSVNVNGSVSHNEASDVEKANESDVEVGSKSDHSPYAVSNEWENTNARTDEISNEVASVSDGNSTPPPQNQNEPLSYASMVNKNFYNATPFPNSTNNFVSKPNDGGILSAPFAKSSVESTIVPVSLPAVTSQTTTSVTSTTSGVGKPPVSGHVREQKSGRAARGHPGGKQRNDSREVTPAYGDNDSSAGETNDFSNTARRQQFSDEQQVFVGNLQQDITEEQLKQFFGKFGTILDVRINRANQKSGRTPNYGFVTFDDPSVVKEILSKKPIYFNDHRFNVEEKRSQQVRGGDRPGREGSRSGSGGGGGGGHGSSAVRAVNNNVGNAGSRVPLGNGQRRDRGDRGNQSFSGNDSGRRNGGGGGGPRGGGSNYNRR